MRVMNVQGTSPTAEDYSDNAKDDMKTKIVVLGTGFAGSSFIEAFNKALGREVRKRVSLTAVNSKDYLLFSPLLYEVATGQVYEYHVSLPICCSIEGDGYSFIEAEVRDISPEMKAVVTSRGVLHFDKLVIALGSESNDFGIEGVKEFAIPLKKLKDGERAKNRILQSYKESLLTTDGTAEKRALLTFVVIGGGAAGIELSSAIVEFIDDLNRNHGSREMRPRVVLIELQDRLMKDLGTEFSDKLSRILSRKGVELSLGRKVVRVSRDTVLFSDGSEIDTKNVFWTAGVKIGSVVSSLERRTVPRKGDRIIVNKYLSITGFEDIFVIGDSAFPLNESNEPPIPQTAAVAVQEGKYAGTMLARELNGKRTISGFRYVDHGTFLSTGSFSGICKLSNGVIVTGLSAWLLWRFIHLFRISTIRNKFEILSDWIFSGFHKKIFIESE